jgi:hypothetical protein
MLVDFRNWVSSIITGYVFSYGRWVEKSAIDTSRYCVVQAAGGSAPVLDARYPRFRVVLLGRRNSGEDAHQLFNDANALILSGIEGSSLPCGAANVRAMGEVTGPGFTQENRAWVQVDFEVIF